MTEIVDKSAPAADSGLACLPPELLLHIVSYVGNSKELCRLTGTYRRLRDLLINTPYLWTEVDCQGDKSWGRLCIVRSGPHLLDGRVTIGGPASLNNSLLHLVIPRAFRLNIAVVDPDFLALMCFKYADTILPLEDLILRFINKRERVAQDDKTWHGNRLEWEPELERLEVRDAIIESFPHMCTLVVLDLQVIDCDPIALHTMLAHNPRLKTLRLDIDNELMYWTGDPEEVAALHPISLPRLQVLVLSSSDAKCTFISAVLSFLPDPLIRLSVVISTKKMKEHLSSKRIHALSIITRLVEFWKRKTGEQELPDGRLDIQLHARRWCLMEFGEQGDSPQSVLNTMEPMSPIYFQCPVLLDGPLPVFDQIKALHVDLAGARHLPWKLAVSASDRNADWLTGLGKLVLIHGQVQTKVEAHTTLLNTWLEKRVVKMFPKLDLELVGCSKALRDVGWELSKKGVIEGFTWDN